jgi:hypothetical protein
MKLPAVVSASEFASGIRFLSFRDASVVRSN